MRPIVQASLTRAIPAARLPEAARNQGGVVCFAVDADVVANAIISSAALFARSRGVSRKEGVNLCRDALHLVVRPRRFALLEARRNKAVRDGYEKVASILHFRDGRRDGSACTQQRVGKQNHSCRAGE